MARNLTQSEIIAFSKGVLAKKVAKVAQAETYGINPCNEDFNLNLMCWLIIDMFECNNAESLNQEEKDCLLGKLENDLSQDCCA